VPDFRDDLTYTAEHEWVSADDPAVIGITSVATEALGDIVYLELPAVGDQVTAGEVCGEVESTKSVSDLFSPVTGTVVAVNEEAVADPSIVNADPYGEGWLLRVDVQELGPTLTAEEYAELTQG